MTYKEAAAYEQQLKELITSLSLEYHVPEDAADSIIDHYVTITLDGKRNNMVFLGNESFTVKPGNVRIDLKAAVYAGIEFFIALNKPESLINY